MMRALPPCLAAALALLPGAAAAAPLLIVTGNDYPPFAAAGMPDGGFSLPLVTSVFKAAGIETVIEIVPWRRGYDMVVRGDAVATFPYVETPERRNETAFSAPLYDVVQDLVGRHGRPLPYDGRPESLKGLTVCMPHGFALPPALDAYVAQGAMVRVSPEGLRECAGIVALGRADVMIGDRWSLRQAIVAAGEQANLSPLLPPFSRIGHHAVFSRAVPDWAKLLEAFNRGLERVKTTPIYAEWLRTNIDAVPDPP